METLQGIAPRVRVLHSLALGSACVVLVACTSTSSGPIRAGYSNSLNTSTIEKAPTSFAEKGDRQAVASTTAAADAQVRSLPDGAPAELAALATGGASAEPIGNAYQIRGEWYQPESDADYSKVGLASWYGDQFHGRLTANGETFDSASLTAAHPTLPLPSYVRVTNLDNDRSMLVRVNDRGPFHADRLIDVSERTAHMLGFRKNGVAEVKVDYLGPASEQPDDEAILLASYKGPEQTPAQSDEVLVAFAATARPEARPALPFRTLDRKSQPQITLASARVEPTAAMASELRPTLAADDRIASVFADISY